MGCCFRIVQSLMKLASVRLAGHERKLWDDAAKLLRGVEESE